MGIYEASHSIIYTNIFPNKCSQHSPPRTDCPVDFGQLCLHIKMSEKTQLLIGSNLHQKKKQKKKTFPDF